MAKWVASSEAMSSVPRTVFQYWEQGALSPCLQRVVDANVADNPSWRFRLLNLSDAPDLLAHAERQGPVPGLTRAFECISPGFPQARSDVLRYSALLLHGGVYLDIKARALKPLDDVFVRTPAVFGHEPPGSLVVWDHSIGPRTLISWGLAAPAGHAKLVTILNALTGNLLGDSSRRVASADERRLIGKKASVVLVGPVMLSKALDWDAPSRRCRATGVATRSGRAMDPFIAYDGTKGCYYQRGGNNATAGRVRYELSDAPLVACPAEAAASPPESGANPRSNKQRSREAAGPVEPAKPPRCPRPCERFLRGSSSGDRVVCFHAFAATCGPVPPGETNTCTFMRPTQRGTVCEAVRTRSEAYEQALVYYSV